MIDQILDLTRARLAGGLEIQTARVNVCDLLTEVVEELRVAHPSRLLLLDCPSGMVANLDHDRLAQLFSNLVGNAIHHGSPGSAVTVRAHEGSASTIHVAVHNQGEPIPEGLRAKLFDPFRRGSRDSRTSRTAGLGLGLYISQEVAVAHGGQIEVESDPVYGTTFTVIVPRSLKAVDPSNRKAPEELPEP
jgi:signal transduction histidine kinase